ncbi:MAG TPA: TetR/AcrR family transcriptional regulator [Candidatus Acetothermia bacterium]|nr:TetR/AcrR family transcriptional regulator [Candidatus Acetothermia bacterium]
MAMRKGKQSTRDRILEAALRLFSSRGYERVSVTAIAQEAGVSRPSFYRYFRNKRDVLLALLRNWHDLMEWIRRSGEPEGRSAWELLEAGGLRVIDSLLATPVLLRAELLFLHHATHDPEARKALAATFKAARAAARDLVELSPDPVDADTLSVFAVALLEGLLIQHAVDPEAIDPAALWPRLLHLCQGKPA